jgi:hypothetical protein
MIHRETVLAILIAASLCATACTHPVFGLYSAVEGTWGDAYESQVEAQIAHPDGPASVDAPEGIDASTAERVAKRYYKGQETQQTRRTPSVVIGEMR